jgi:predicted GTPase
VTEEVAGILVRWQGKQDGELFIAVDGPGFGDSEGHDTKHIADIVTKLKLIGYVHTFVIVISSEERYNQQ